MTIWIDAQLSPAIATWITDTFAISALPIQHIGLRDAEDREIFDAARIQNAIVMTKDKDFIRLLEQFGSPPKVIWLTCGNTSNTRLQEILTKTLQTALDLLAGDEDLVEINAWQ